MSKAAKAGGRRTYADVDPKLKDQTFVAKFEEPALWTECNRKYREFWSQHDRSRSPPQHYRNPDRNKVGWWFPEKWRRDFKAVPAKPEKSAKSESSPAERTHYVDTVIVQALAKISDDSHVSPKEAERWQLPAGTQITPHEVIYRDGSRESVDDVRLRHPKFHEGALRQSSEQQLLEDTLRTLHRRRA